MFKREIKVSMVKPSKSADQSTTASEPMVQVYTANAMAVLQTVGENATRMMVSYMICDTIRKIAINRLSK
jgi:hypothetical protein